MEKNDLEIVLGDKYRHILHKEIVGIATGHTKYITGCDQVGLESVVSGKIEEIWVDVSLLEHIKPKKRRKVVTKPKKDIGGPRSHPPSKYYE